MLAADKNACDIILLPEMFSTGFSMNAALLAEEAGGRTMRWMEKLANTTNAWVLGSYIIRENNQFFNRMVCMAPGGTYKQYDKRHLFSLAAEEKTYSPGKERIFVSVKGWKIVPLICYDLRFPVWSRNTDDFDSFNLSCQLDQKEDAMPGILCLKPGLLKINRLLQG